MASFPSHGRSMHPRNKYAEASPDFASLSEQYPSLAPYLVFRPTKRHKGEHEGQRQGDGTEVDSSVHEAPPGQDASLSGSDGIRTTEGDQEEFRQEGVRSRSQRRARVGFRWDDYNATRHLTRVLLAHDFGVEWWIEDGLLCPTVPNRANYIHWLQDLLAMHPAPWHSNAKEGSAKTDSEDVTAVRGLDVGTGANLIYPLLGATICGWQFVGTDVTGAALSGAKANLERNPHLAPLIELRCARHWKEGGVEKGSQGTKEGSYSMGVGEEGAERDRQQPEIGCQGPEIGCQGPEIGCQGSEIGRQGQEIGCQGLERGCQAPPSEGAQEQELCPQEKTAAQPEAGRAGNRAASGKRERGDLGEGMLPPEGQSGADADDEDRKEGSDVASSKHLQAEVSNPGEGKASLGGEGKTGDTFPSRSETQQDDRAGTGAVQSPFPGGLEEKETQHGCCVLQTFPLPCLHLHREGEEEESQSDMAVLSGAVGDSDRFDFCMCNPPFFDNLEAAGSNPRTACGGTFAEMVFPQGGEVGFIRRMIEDSVSFGNRIHWYTTMVGKKRTLKGLSQQLWARGAKAVLTTEFVQGRTSRWGLAWTFSSVLGQGKGSGGVQGGGSRGAPFTYPAREKQLGARTDVGGLKGTVPFSLNKEIHTAPRGSKQVQEQVQRAARGWQPQGAPPRAPDLPSPLPSLSFNVEGLARKAGAHHVLMAARDALAGVPSVVPGSLKVDEARFKVSASMGIGGGGPGSVYPGGGPGSVSPAIGPGSVFSGGSWGPGSMSPAVGPDLEPPTQLDIQVSVMQHAPGCAAVDVKTRLHSDKQRATGEKGLPTADHARFVAGMLADLKQAIKRGSF